MYSVEGRIKINPGPRVSMKKSIKDAPNQHVMKNPGIYNYIECI